MNCMPMELHAIKTSVQKTDVLHMQCHFRLRSLVSVPVMFGKPAKRAALQHCLQQLRLCPALQLLHGNADRRALIVGRFIRHCKLALLPKLSWPSSSETES